MPYFENSIANPCHVGHPRFNAQKWLQRLKFDGNRTEQLDSVESLPSGSTVLAKGPSNENLHHNHN